MEADHLHLVMTYCPGGDLFSKVRRARERGRPFPEARVVTWLMQLVSALAYIHSKKIMHRDLKTQNIFIGRDGSLRLGDFGLAKVLERTDDFATTFTGTPFYLAPEICMSQNYGFQSDLWSLGCILYELCSLEHAFAADSLLSLVYKIVRGNFEPLPAGRYDPRLCALVDALLAREPGARPTARALWRDPWLAAKKADIEEWVEAKQRGRVARPAPEPWGGGGGGAAAPGGSLGSSGASEGGEAPEPGPRGAAPASLSEQALTPRERMLARKAEAARLRQMELQVAGREQARSRLAPAAGRGAGGAAASGTSCDGIIGTQSDFVRVEQPAAARSPKETAKSDPSPDRSELLRPGGAGAAGLNQTFRGRGHQAGGGASGLEPPAPGGGRGGEGGAGGRPAADGCAVWSPKRPLPAPAGEEGEQYESDFEDYADEEDGEVPPEELDFSPQSGSSERASSLELSQQRGERICSLRGRCESALGAHFQAVYDYLRGVRQADDGVGLKAEEDEDIRQALELLAGPGGLKACFQVDLLVFQELVAAGG